MVEARTTVNDVHGGTPSNLTNKRWPCQRIDDRTVTVRKSVHGKPSTRRHGEVSSAVVETSLGRHFLDKFARVNELVAKPWMNFWIKYLLEPVDGQSTARRLARIGVVGKPNVSMISMADIHRNDRRAERDRKGRQHADSGALLDGIEMSRAGVRADRNNVIDAFDPEEP